MQQFYNYDPFSGKDEAINNLGGAEQLYHKYVERFQVNHQKTGTRLTDYLENNNYENAYILVHSVHGIALTLGMVTLSRRASILEGALKEGRYKNLPSLVNSFQDALHYAIHFPCLQSSSSSGMWLSGI
jgi:HPt (histidine-containing phosphotransfer) domain-containing protein